MLQESAPSSKLIIELTLDDSLILSCYCLHPQKDRLFSKVGKPFRILKFRTMTEDASGLPLTVGDDIRLTKCSRFLRKLKLDELPQLINVLKGDMCIVGPRPDMPWQLDMYTSRERARILVLPGITGLTQIMNRRELSNADNYELDVCYVERSTI
ncbi:MAG: sugar transferase [Proteobacteria bacterium]|nr:sugar transferase [Pseudomonadota bacterium]